MREMLNLCRHSGSASLRSFEDHSLFACSLLRPLEDRHGTSILRALRTQDEEPRVGIHEAELEGDVRLRLNHPDVRTLSWGDRTRHDGMRAL